MSAATITLLFLLFAVVMFVFEKIPLGVTSMIVCIGLVVTGVLDIKTAFAGFIDSNVILFVAMFIVGGALFETGMANKIGGIVTHFAKSERSLIVAIMVIVGLMSGVLSNTGTAAVLIPVVIGIAAKSGYARSKLLMPLVFAAAMGGNLSLIGAPGNLIAQSALGEIGMSFGFFEYAIVGLPILVAGILFYATLGMKLLPNHPVSDDDSFSGEQDFSNVPKWKQVLSFVILVLTLLGMIFEKQIGIKLNIIGCIGALALLILMVMRMGYSEGGEYDRRRNLVYSNKGTYGTAGFLSRKELAGVLDLVPDIRKHSGTILGELDHQVICIPPKTRFNGNLAVYGASGSKKTRAFCVNMILQCAARKSSLVICDPKSELYEKTSEYLRDQGYTVRVFNLVTPSASDSWNCLAEVGGQELMAQLFCDVIIKNTGGEERDHFWDSAEMNLLKALVLYVSTSYPKKKQNSMIRNVHKAVLLLQVLRIAIRRKCGESIVVLLLLTDAGMYYIGRRSDCQWRGM